MSFTEFYKLDLLNNMYLSFVHISSPFKLKKVF